MGKLLIFNSLVTLICGCWLALMEILLRHTGFASRAAIALLIAATCVAALLARMLHLDVRHERWFWPAALALIWFGGSSFLRNARAAHFEGFVFVISLILVLQGSLMLATMGRTSGRSRLTIDVGAPAARSR